MIVREEGVIESGDFKLGFEGFKVWCCNVLVVVEDS